MLQIGIENAKQTGVINVNGNANAIRFISSLRAKRKDEWNTSIETVGMNIANKNEIFRE
jgi:hypothetical protein